MVNKKVAQEVTSSEETPASPKTAADIQKLLDEAEPIDPEKVKAAMETFNQKMDDSQIEYQRRQAEGDKLAQNCYISGRTDFGL
ncbi:MAG: hypothetical protein M3Q34_01010 [bacterium]|nr:hypothetical protein [bacterium]